LFHLLRLLRLPQKKPAAGNSDPADKTFISGFFKIVFRDELLTGNSGSLANRFAGVFPYKIMPFLIIFQGKDWLAGKVFF
jgi:hypothetical protein